MGRRPTVSPRERGRPCVLDVLRGVHPEPPRTRGVRLLRRRDAAERLQLRRGVPTPAARSAAPRCTRSTPSAASSTTSPTTRRCATPHACSRRWREELDAVYAGTPTHPIGVALADAVRRFPLDRRHFVDLIRGVEMDLTPPALRDLRRARRVLLPASPPPSGCCASRSSATASRRPGTTRAISASPSS